MKKIQGLARAEEGIKSEGSDEIYAVEYVTQIRVAVYICHNAVARSPSPQAVQSRTLATE